MLNKKILFSALILIIGLTVVSNEAIAQEQTEATLTGQVVDATTQQALADVQVMVDGEDMETTTDTDGSFSFEGLSAGTYTLMAQAEGYQDWESSVTVSEDGESVTIEMEPSDYEE